MYITRGPKMLTYNLV